MTIERKRWFTLLVYRGGKRFNLVLWGIYILAMIKGIEFHKVEFHIGDFRANLFALKGIY